MAAVSIRFPPMTLIRTDYFGCFNEPHTERAACFWQIEARPQRLLVVMHRSKALAMI
jgi:hypothetical protein